MGGSQASKLMKSNKLTPTETIDNLSYLEDGQFAKIYKGHWVLNKAAVTIKVPRVPPEIRKEKSKSILKIYKNGQNAVSIQFVQK